MSDYTPTTELIEANYVHSNAIQRAGFGNTNADYAAEFDRWLVQHDSEIVEAYRQKLIALNEDKVTLKSESLDALTHYWIAKGERRAEEHIINLIEADRNKSHAVDDLFDGVVFQTISRSEFKSRLISLIKGENK